VALKLVEGFDWLETADLPGAYSAFSDVQPVGTMTQTIQTGRNGDKCLRIVPGTATNDETPNNIQGKSFSSGLAGGSTIIVGFAIKVNTFNESGFAVFAGILSASGTGDSQYNILLAINSSKQIVPGFRSGGAFTNFSGVGATSTVLVAGNWYYVELKFFSHNSTGTIEICINGVSELAATGKDTLLNDNGVTALVIGSTIPVTTVPSIDFDDLYIADTSGSVNNDFLGDVQVKQLIPTGNGNSSQFVGSDADSTDNYLLVDDDGVPDDDSTYVESPTTTNKDTYAYENLPAAVVTVKAVCVKVLGKKVDVGAADLKTVARSNGTEADSAAIGMTTSYTAKAGIFEVDPDTSAAWLPAAVDAAEFGIKVA